MNIQSAILRGENILKDQLIKSARLDTEILMAKALGVKREYIILNQDKNVDEKYLDYFEKLIQKRATRKPIAYLLNNKFFWNNQFFINKNTLIPRPDTEIIIEQVLKITKNKNKLRILDIGVGYSLILLQYQVSLIYFYF